MVTISGGKWTTYRKMAEDLVNQVEEFEGWERRECGTQEFRIETSGAQCPQSFVEKEMARQVEDILARRSRALVTDARGATSDAERVAQEMADPLGKDANWVTNQVAEFGKVAVGWIPPASLG